MTEAMWAAAIGAGVGAVLGILSAWWAGLCSSESQAAEEGARRQAELAAASQLDAHASFTRARAAQKKAEDVLLQVRHMLDEVRRLSDAQRRIDESTARLTNLRPDEDFAALGQVLAAEAREESRPPLLDQLLEEEGLVDGATEEDRAHGRIRFVRRQGYRREAPGPGDLSVSEDGLQRLGETGWASPDVDGEASPS